MLLSKCLVVLGKGSTREKGEDKFHVWTYFIINFALCLVFSRVCPKDDPPLEIRPITRIIYYICCCLYIINIFIEHFVISRIYQVIHVYIYIYIHIYQGLFWSLGAWVHFLGQISKKGVFCLLATPK